MELRHLRYFVAVAEKMNFHQAARHLNISQPPLSLTIQQLEEEIGTQLFNRIGRSIRITRAGEAFLEYAKNALKDAEAAKQNAFLLGAGKKGVLKIGFVSSAVTGILQNIVLHSRQKNPEIKLEISQAMNSKLAEQVLAKEYDIGLLRYPEYMPGNIIAHRLTQEHWCAAVRKDHSFARLRSVTIKKLAKEQIIFYPRYNNPAGYDDLMNLFSAHGVKPNIIQEAPEQMTIAGLVTSGLGVGIVPACMAKIKIDSLTHIPIQHTLYRTGFMIIHRDESDQLIEEFVSLIRVRKNL
jgi:DNA-binding transcriptional LysR family regulator